MSSTARRAVIALVALGAVGGAGAVVAARANDGAAPTAQTTPSTSPSTAAPAHPTMARPVGTSAPIAVPTPSAPGKLPVEPGPNQPVATDPPAPESGGAVQVVVTYADWDASGHQVEVAGYVSGVVEAGGTCTLTLVKGAEKVSSTAAAEPDASTMTCGSLDIPGAKVSAGQWRATMSYRSSTSHGESAPVDVTVAG